MLCFAYGSNMCSDWLKARAPSAQYVAVGHVVGRSLRFHKKSPDGSTKADAVNAGNSSDVVWGVLFEIDPAEKPNLDKSEGLGQGYHEEELEVVLDDGPQQKAWAYIADASGRDPSLRPYDWYLRLVVAGARARGLPSDYIGKISATPRQKDPRTDRETRMRAETCRC